MKNNKDEFKSLKDKLIREHNTGYPESWTVVFKALSFKAQIEQEEEEARKRVEKSLQNTIWISNRLKPGLTAIFNNKTGFPLSHESSKSILTYDKE